MFKGAVVRVGSEELLGLEKVTDLQARFHVCQIRRVSPTPLGSLRGLGGLGIPRSLA